MKRAKGPRKNEKKKEKKKKKLTPSFASADVSELKLLEEAEGDHEEPWLPHQEPPFQPPFEPPVELPVEAEAGALEAG